MNRFALLASCCCCSRRPALPQPPQKSRLDRRRHRVPPANGLRVLTLPDPGVDTITVHIIYLVGSRHEGYGEKGMAHLLEHLLFKGSQAPPNIKEELTRRGARWNGTTSNDRTNYFETFAATDDNLDWALGLEADRMVNSFVAQEDLDSEMTVVRNEFEIGREQPRRRAVPAHAAARLPVAQLRQPDHRQARRHRERCRSTGCRPSTAPGTSPTTRC